MYLQCKKLGQFSMPKTCQNCLGHVNSYVYHEDFIKWKHVTGPLCMEFTGHR